MRTKKKKRAGHPRVQLLKTVKPGNDFYKYVNTVWEQTTTLEPIFNSTSVFHEMQEVADECLLQAICSLKPHTGRLSEKEKRDNLIINLKKSVEVSPHSHNNIISLQKKISEIQCLRSKEEIVMFLGKLNTLGCPSMIFFKDKEDPYDTRKVYWALELGEYSLGDREFYRNNEYGTPSFWKMYKNYIKYLEMEWRQEEGLSEIPDLERQFSEDQGRAFKKQSKKISRNYLYSGEEIAKKYSAFPWQHYFDGLGISGWKHIKMVMDNSSKATIKVFINYLEKESLTAWKNWLTLLVLNHGVQFSTPELAERWHDFFFKSVTSLPKRKTGNDLFLSIAKGYAHIPLNEIYKEHCFTKAKKDSLKPFFDNLIQTTIKLIGDADWMRTKTRQHAIQKVKNMSVCIAYPEGSYNYHSPELLPEHLLENIYLLAQTNYKYMIERITHASLRDVWTKPIFNVNAHYSLNMNRIIFPAAILESPFYVYGGSLGWNYGALGATVGHEITHAFDQDGMLIDEHGKKSAWYTDHDKKEYEKRTNDLIDIFDNIKEQGKYLNGYNIVSEAIADLGGLSIALEALKKEMNRRKLSEDKQKEEMRMFFISYSFTWRKKTRAKFALQSVFIDEHPPNWTRVNYIVNHFQEFHDLFDVSPDQDLYLEPKKRIKYF